jgi:hypothetical protein
MTISFILAESRSLWMKSNFATGWLALASVLADYG